VAPASTHPFKSAASYSSLFVIGSTTVAVPLPPEWVALQQNLKYVLEMSSLICKKVQHIVDTHHNVNNW